MTNSYDVAHGLSQDEPGPLEPVEIAQQDDTLARTGNTARDQEMYAAGIRTGEENAKHNAAIRAGAGWLPIESAKSTIQKWARISREKVGLGHVHFHDLRHSTASELINNDVDLYTVGAILGHKDPRSTKRYAHLDQSRLTDAIARMGQKKRA